MTERAELWALLGDLRELAGVLDGSVEAYRRAASLTTDPVARADYIGPPGAGAETGRAPGPALRTVAAARRLLDQAPGDAARRVGVRLDYLTAVASSARRSRGGP